MQTRSFSIDGPLLISPERFGDERGFFSEVYNARALQSIGIDAHFVQDNHSFSAQKGVIRGLHFQSEPHAQGKLVRVTQGAALDVIVDIRRGSPTYGKHIKVELSAQNWRQLWVPVGFAHGFCTLSENVEFLYKVTGYHAPECNFGLAYDDPALDIEWPVSTVQAILSENDRKHPRLQDLLEYFSI